MVRKSALDRTQVLPFAQASDLHFRIARSFALITDWNAALNGHFPIADVVAILTKQVEARNVALYRLREDTVHAIATQARAYDTTKPERSSGALARYIMANHKDALTSGSIWRLKELRNETGFDETPAALEWANRPEICEVSLIVLEAMEDQIDIIEMIFDTPPRPTPELPVSIVTQAMADAWSLRAAGLVSRTIQTYGRSRASKFSGIGIDILSEENPCGLSRAEQRVCQLLATGIKAKDIASVLKVSVPTVRSHLRNLYAKTETNGQGDLIALISDTKSSAP